RHSLVGKWIYFSGGRGDGLILKKKFSSIAFWNEPAQLAGAVSPSLSAYSSMIPIKQHVPDVEPCLDPRALAGCGKTPGSNQQFAKCKEWKFSILFNAPVLGRPADLV